MTESRILWLALGVFVGYVIWGERQRHRGIGGASMIDVTDSGGGGTVTSDNGGFTPSTHSCGGGCQ